MTMKTKFAAVFLLLLSMLAASAYAGLKDDIKVTLMEKQVHDLSSDGLVLVFYLHIANSSSRPYFLSGYDYRFVVNQVDFIRLQTPVDSGIKVESKRSAVIALPVKITYAYLFKAVPSTEGEESVSCYLMGRLRFSDGRRDKGEVPIAFSGEFPVFRNPVMELLSLQINALTIAGSDLKFRVKIKNTNGFELPVDRIEYELKFGGHPVARGRFPGDKNIPLHGERVFTLPLLLNFYEVGKDVYGLLRQTEMSVHFTGEIELKTIWGRITLPFDLEKKVGIEQKKISGDA